MKKLLTSLGYDSSLYGEHSGKRGGATSAAANGATDKQLKRLRGWRSDSMPAKYVDLSVPSRILLSEMLQKSSQSQTLSLNNKLSLYFVQTDNLCKKQFVNKVVFYLFNETKEI